MFDFVSRFEHLFVCCEDWLKLGHQLHGLVCILFHPTLGFVVTCSALSVCKFGIVIVPLMVVVVWVMIVIACLVKCCKDTSQFQSSSLIYSDLQKVP